MYYDINRFNSGQSHTDPQEFRVFTVFTDLLPLIAGILMISNCSETQIEADRKIYFTNNIGSYNMTIYLYDQRVEKYICINLGYISQLDFWYENCTDLLGNPT